MWMLWPSMNFLCIWILVCVLPSPTSVCASECGLMYVHVCLCGLVYVRACVCVRGCVGVGVWACVTVRVFVCSPLYLDWCLIVLLQVTFKTKIYHCNITSQVCSHNHWYYCTIIIMALIMFMPLTNPTPSTIVHTLQYRPQRVICVILAPSLTHEPVNSLPENKRITVDMQLRHGRRVMLTE